MTESAFVYGVFLLLEQYRRYLVAVIKLMRVRLVVTYMTKGSGTLASVLGWEWGGWLGALGYLGVQGCCEVREI